MGGLIIRDLVVSWLYDTFGYTGNCGGNYHCFYYNSDVTSFNIWLYDNYIRIVIYLDNCVFELTFDYADPKFFEDVYKVVHDNDFNIN